MKKLLTWVLVFALLLTFVGCTNNSETPAADSPETSAPAQDSVDTPDAPVPEETDAPAAEEQSQRITVDAGQPLVDFEKGTEGLAFWDLSAYGFVEPEASIVTDADAYLGQGLRVDIGGDNTRGVMNLQIVGLNEDVSAGMANAGDYEYMRFWVNNQGGADVSIAVLMVVSSELKNGCLNPEGAVLYNQFGEEVSGWPDNAAQVSTVQGGTRNTSLSIPAGFVGWAYYPIHDQVCWWEGVTLDDEQVKAVDCLTFDIRYIDATEAEYIVIDDICLANAP